MQVQKCVLHLVLICLTFGSIEALYKDFQISHQDPKNKTHPGDGCDASLIKEKAAENSNVLQRVWVEGALWLEPHNCASLGNGTRDFEKRKNLVRVDPKNKTDILFCCTYNDFGRSRAELRENSKNNEDKNNYFALEKCLTRDREFRYYDANGLLLKIKFK